MDFDWWYMNVIDSKRRSIKINQSSFLRLWFGHITFHLESVNKNLVTKDFNSNAVFRQSTFTLHGWKYEKISLLTGLLLKMRSFQDLHKKGEFKTTVQFFPISTRKHRRSSFWSDERTAGCTTFLQSKNDMLSSHLLWWNLTFSKNCILTCLITSTTLNQPIIGNITAFTPSSTFEGHLSTLQN